MTITKIAIFSNHSCYGSAIKQIESLLKIITFPTDHCDDNFLRPQKSPNYLSIPAAVKLLNDERQLISYGLSAYPCKFSTQKKIQVVSLNKQNHMAISALNDRKDFGIPVLAVVLVQVSGLASIALVPLREILGAGAVYLHYLNRSRKQYILYEIACIHHHKFPYATWINFNSSSSIIYLRRD
ncbi:hypothetical protein T02_16208 [Trichinella nativa]|uniref:Uncharacterized protein n=1 Tax=Trichinella nativa TaxID=6335 RepID=A0A0V1LEK3_9BILA|nr:hypothetical protein T02_16208 [Trichinella nativa]